MSLDSVIGDLRAGIAELETAIDECTTRLAEHNGISPAKKAARAGWEVRHAALTAELTKLEGDRARENERLRRLVSAKSDIAAAAAQRPSPNVAAAVHNNPVHAHKPKMPSVFDPVSHNFKVWSDTVRRYFSQVTCLNVASALLDFVSGTAATELAHLIERNGDSSSSLSVDACLEHLRCVCVDHMRNEKNHRSLFDVSANSPVDFVREFWNTYDNIPSEERDGMDFLWLWTLLLHRAEFCRLPALAKELRKDIFKDVKPGEKTRISVQEFRVLTHLAVGIPTTDHSGHAHDMDCDAVDAVDDVFPNLERTIVAAVQSALSRSSVSSPPGRSARVDCKKYLAGECTWGPRCNYNHPLKPGVCKWCGVTGHGSWKCAVHKSSSSSSGGGRRPPSQGVTK
jgi:hypothetical protein